MQTLDIDLDIPYAEYPPTFEDLNARVKAAAATLFDIAEAVEVTDEDVVTARNILTGAEQASDAKLASPGTVVHLYALLDAYDKQVVQSAVQIRNYVTNKLLEDSTNSNPQIRVKCYELLGKISDVGLFTDKTEVTMRHRPTAELEQLLRERLMKTLEGTVLPQEQHELAQVKAALDGRTVDISDVDLPQRLPDPVP